MIKQDYWPTKEWKYKDNEDLELDIEKLLFLDKQIVTKYKNINGLVVIKNGYVEFERYYNGFIYKDSHSVASVTKSIVSALVGICIDKGFIKSIDNKVVSFFPEYNFDKDNFTKNQTTIKQLLTMTAPFSFGKHEPLDRLRRQKDWVKYTLDLLGQKGMSRDFEYSTSGVHLLSAIISKTTGLSAREFANKHLFDPIGMNVIPDYKMKSFGLDDVFGKNVKGWVSDPMGISAGGWGITLTARNMAKFGFLYLNEGNWDGEQIISKQWVNDSTKIYSHKYGYLWWIHDEDNMKGFIAAGDGGNTIFCIPESNLIVSITATMTGKVFDTPKFIKEVIIPTINE